MNPNFRAPLIEKVAPPTCRARYKYPWSELKDDNDSFFIKTPPGVDTRYMANSIRSAGGQWCRRRRPTHRAVVRQVDGGVRVWLLPTI